MAHFTSKTKDDFDFEYMGIGSLTHDSAVLALVAIDAPWDLYEVTGSGKSIEVNYTPIVADQVARAFMGTSDED